MLKNKKKLQLSKEGRMVNLNRVEYALFSGKLPARSLGVNLYNDVFEAWFNFWVNFWSQSVGECGREEKVKLNLDFLRQDFVSCILVDQVPVAFQLHSVFDYSQKNVMALPYFEIHDEESFKFFRDNGVRSAISFEYLSVVPEWRKQVSGKSLWAPVLNLLGMKIRHELHIDAGLATARKSAKVNEMCSSLGWEMFRKDVDYRGYACDLLATFKFPKIENVDPEVHAMSEYLWKNKVDYSSLEYLREVMTQRRLLKVA